MRGADVIQEALFTVGGLDQFVLVDHPLRRVRDVFNGCLARMDTPLTDSTAHLDANRFRPRSG